MQLLWSQQSTQTKPSFLSVIINDAYSSVSSSCSNHIETKFNWFDVIRPFFFLLFWCIVFLFSACSVRQAESLYASSVQLNVCLHRIIQEQLTVPLTAVLESEMGRETQLSTMNWEKKKESNINKIYDIDVKLGPEIKSAFFFLPLYLLEVITYLNFSSAAGKSDIKHCLHDTMSLN